ncbi:MAG: hypothetical protein GY832_28570 [Chloroflexi bacterium]|nr:hypothetical protein [Chloroflexota bacterium]
MKKNKRLIVAVTAVVILLACIGAVAGLYMAVESGLIPNPHASGGAIQVLGNVIMI